ncbi:MAG TPA: type VI secretion system baseplate subunit TssK [Vicinamibacterales bacterium]
MSSHSRVIWSEGLFLQPQHFQQQERYFERYVEGRCQPLVPYSWGFTELEFEADFLRIGKAALRQAAGVFPDGTPFRLPDDDPLPEPIDIGTDVRDQILYLAVPLRRTGQLAADRDGDGDALVRHDVRELETRSDASSGGEPALVEVGALRTRLLLANEVTAAYACIPLAHIVECRADRQVVLNENFIPTVLRVSAARRLAAFTTELLGLFHQRGEALAGRVAATGRGAAAEFAEFLMLQAINRFEPLLAHCAEAGNFHPESLFQLCASAAGELATFTSTSKRPPRIPAYRHERLRDSFDPVIAALRESLSKVLVQSAISIPIEPKKFGISVAIVSDRSLYNSAVFILAARADVAAEDLRRRFPAQVKIGPAEKIADLVRLALPGVPVHAIPVAPRQIPFHAGFAYFELDQTVDLWEQLKDSGGIAMHVAGEFPGLALEFWAIRS